MSAAVDSALPSAGGGFVTTGDGGTGDDDKDPSRRKDISKTHAIDVGPVFFPEDEDGDQYASDDVPTQIVTDSTGKVTPPQQRRSVITHLRGRLDQSSSDATTLDESNECQVCGKSFRSPKALHGHMRSHPERSWRGVLPPGMCPKVEKETAEFMLLISGRGEVSPRPKYECSSCHKEFTTKQALGGHRATHKNKLGCFAKSKERQVLHVNDEGTEQKKVVERKRRGRKKSNNGAGFLRTMPECHKYKAGEQIEVKTPVIAPYVVEPKLMITSPLLGPVASGGGPSSSSAKPPMGEGPSGVIVGTQRGRRRRQSVRRRRRMLDLSILPRSSSDEANGNRSSDSSSNNNSNGDGGSGNGDGEGAGNENNSPPSINKEAPQKE